MVPENGAEVVKSPRPPKPSPLTIELVARQLIIHMGLPDEITAPLMARAEWWLRKSYRPSFKSSEVVWFRATADRITRKPRHFKRIEGGKPIAR